MASNRTILGIDPAACTGMAIRVTDESGYRTISTRAVEVKIASPIDADNALVEFAQLDTPDRIVIEGMFVGVNPHNALVLERMAGWYEAICARYWPDAPVSRPIAKEWRAAVNIQGKTESCKEQAIMQAKAAGLLNVGHNAAEAFCMTFYEVKR